MPDPITRSAIEIDGQSWVVWRRPFEGRPGQHETSFDGETFHEKGSEAYFEARKAGKLIRADSTTEVADLPEDAAASMLELVRLIRSLRPGEELRVIHTGSALNVVKNKLVASFRPSIFEETGIDPAKED